MLPSGVGHAQPGHRRGTGSRHRAGHGVDRCAVLDGELHRLELLTDLDNVGRGVEHTAGGGVGGTGEHTGGIGDLDHIVAGQHVGEEVVAIGIGRVGGQQLVGGVDDTVVVDVAEEVDGDPADA